MKRKTSSALIGITVAFVLLYIIYKIGFSQYFSLEHIKIYSKYLKDFVSERYIISIAIYMLIYFVVIALSIPATGPMTVLGGLLFGVERSIVYSTVSAVLGATAAFLFFRTALRDASVSKYGKQLEKFKKGLHEYGAFYLLILHFLFIFPFFVINSLAALAKVPLWRFIWTTTVGFLPCAIVYSLAGKQITTIKALSDIFSFRVIGTLGLLIGFLIFAMMFKKYRRNIEL